MTQPDPDDTLEGCGGPMGDTPDDVVPYVALFAIANEQHHGVLGAVAHRHDVNQTAREWRELFGGEP
jgi:hypothetical protein